MSGGDPDVFFFRESRPTFVEHQKSLVGVEFLSVVLNFIDSFSIMWFLYHVIVEWFNIIMDLVQLVEMNRFH